MPKIQFQKVFTMKNEVNHQYSTNNIRLKLLLMKATYYNIQG